MSESTENIPVRERRRLVRAFRKEKGLTLAKLGKLAGKGFSESMLHRFENGKRDLSPEKWARLRDAMGKVVSKDEYPGIERRFGSDARAELAEELELIAVLQDNLDNEAFPKTRAWLALEMESALAQKRAMEAAEAAHKERHRNESSDRMRIYPAMKTAEGKYAPWRKKGEGPAPLERLAAAIPADDLQVCLVWNREDEEKLKAEGWKEVQSE